VEKISKREQDQLKAFPFILSKDILKVIQQISKLPQLLGMCIIVIFQFNLVIGKMIQWLYLMHQPLRHAINEQNQLLNIFRWCLKTVISLFSGLIVIKKEKTYALRCLISVGGISLNQVKFNVFIELNFLQLQTKTL